MDGSRIGHGKPGPGRPKSTKSKNERLFDRLMNSRGKNLERIVDQVLLLAEAGETGMIKAVMDRVFPARGRTIKLDLSSDPETAIDRVIIPALDAGDITASEARDFIEILKARMEVERQKNNGPKDRPPVELVDPLARIRERLNSIAEKQKGSRTRAADSG